LAKVLGGVRRARYTVTFVFDGKAMIPSATTLGYQWYYRHSKRKSGLAPLKPTRCRYSMTSFTAGYRDSVPLSAA
jgi:hypothetical protein